MSPSFPSPHHTPKPTKTPSFVPQNNSKNNCTKYRSGCTRQPFAIGQIDKFVGSMIAKSTRSHSTALSTFEMRNRQRTKVTGNSKLSMLGDTSPGTNVTTTYRVSAPGQRRGRKTCKNPSTSFIRRIVHIV